MWGAALCYMQLINEKINIFFCIFYFFYLHLHQLEKSELKNAEGS